MIKLWNLNSICHMHCIAGEVVTFVLLNWAGIYLYLVIANKILRSNASASTILFGKPYTSRELPPLASSFTLFPTTC
jgi:hypothetical protein